MSVLVKGMKMPTRCEDCPVCHYMERGTITACGCKATMMIRPIDCNSKPYWCPLVEVPTPHGRLIDAKALTKDLGNRWNVNDDQDFCNKEVWRGIEDATTIIPAEDGDGT